MLAIVLWRERETVFILETQYNAMRQMFIETRLRSGPEATVSLGKPDVEAHHHRTLQ